MGLVGRMGGAVSTALIALSLLWIEPAQSQVATTCGAFHRIQTGETLRSITLKAYAHDRFSVVFDANRDIISDAARIEIGQLIFLPCEGSGPQTRSEALAVASIKPALADQVGTREAKRLESRGIRDSPAQPVPGPSPSAVPGGASTPVLRDNGSQDAAVAALRKNEFLALSGSGFEPLVDENLPDGGLAALLVRRALEDDGRGRTVRVGFVNDWKAHLSLLLPTGAFSLGFPWPAPDCSGPVAGQATEQMCGNFLFSRPIYEVTVETWGRVDQPVQSATTVADLAGRRICRPRTFPPVDLEAAGQALVIVLARNVAECAKLLSGGEVDAISAPTPLIEKISADKDIWSGFAEVQALRATVPLHALAWRAHPDAAATIAALDAGLARLQGSGEWFRIVAAYLSEYNANKARDGG